MPIIEDAREAVMTGRRTDGARVRRPLSPHLQVYDMVQMTSGLSILNRATGVAWTIGMVFLVWWLVAAATGQEAFDRAQWFFGSFLGILVLAGLTAVAWFHTFAGLRHLYWDFGHGYHLPEVIKTGWAVIIATGVMTVLTWIIALIAW
ncbi:succinate dehydrogenase, cytochrome b556 subunit [Roseomonas marmotae]|uniref:Succinate dehydrogenase cytochrome b556 subunit n=1 Tax=Roseomonas marmotae TaxID=2768161 RepID=A0ABS3K7Z0_9PROT|nr:succinate dehydrogenase, cytochrome b556 subunit [Roseomonas marmotae]MBO1073585.1 succinate dehydrogenase, cytochrome b556 subunit [Roseomonas marmotae]QTI80234.1 succinate dehydrogenase, cytochrome b556 subunit [Roseomonas marmotae]